MRKIKYFKQLLLVFLFVSLPVLADPESIGDVAGSLFEGGVIISKIIHAICITAGIALIFGSLLQYKKHRNNPSEVTFSSVVLTLLAGLALLAVAFIPMRLL